MTNNTSDPSVFLPADEDILAQIDAEAADFIGGSRGTIVGGPDFVARISALPISMETLSPDDREIVNARLQALPVEQRAGQKDAFVRQRVAELSMQSRLKQGPGADANSLAHAKWEVLSEAAALDKRCDEIMSELDEKTFDPATGEAIYKHADDSQARRELEQELALKHELSKDLLEGPTGAQRIARGRAQALEERKQRFTDIHILQEAKRRNAAKDVEDRISALVRK